MGLETFTGKVSDLVATNPPGTDPKSQGDDHLRGIKTTIIGQSVNMQLGQSATATQNFTMNTGLDGTMKLARGNVGATTQDVMTVASNGIVTFPQNVQTLQNLSSNLTNVTYTNTTKQTITVMVALNSSGNQNIITALVNGITIVGSTAPVPGDRAALTFVVPPNGTYKVNGTNGVQTVASWAELR